MFTKKSFDRNKEINNDNLNKATKFSIFEITKNTRDIPVTGDPSSYGSDKRIRGGCGCFCRLRSSRVGPSGTTNVSCFIIVAAAQEKVYGRIQCRGQRGKMSTPSSQSVGVVKIAVITA